MLSGPPVSGTYYIYSFDGRLLAEYNILGHLVRDYIYFGGQLVAEYRQDIQNFYYSASDQINSTRIVTDSAGTVVYSAAHEPYGEIQKTWGVSTYDPELKFSGKPRDAESELDYFGARYYDRAQYRFISVDPVTTVGAAVYDPQSWNLYSYCGNNPLVYVDSTGLYKTPVHYGLTYSLAIQAHFTPAEARIIASANNDVDSGFLSSFHLRSSLQESMESNYLHFPNSAQLASARMGAMNASNLAELGFYLHTIQDSYSHSGSIPVTIFTPVGPIEIQVPVNKITHSLLTAMAALGACYDPDDPMANPSNYAKMRSETFYALLFWRANYIRFSNDVIFQTPCF
jgi:RHS repeat-associated protein